MAYRYPLVSIITPIFNGSETISQAIESVIAQEYVHWELIIVDDGSTDHTSEIVRKYADPRIHYCYQENKGRSSARNLGIIESTGQYLLFLDADDWLLPNSLQDHISFLESNIQYGVSLSDGFFCDYYGNNIARISERRSWNAAGWVLDRLIIDPGIIGGSLAVMVRKQILDEFDLKFDEQLSIGEDWLFWINVARFSEFGFLNKITCKYRWYPENTTNSVSEIYRKNQFIAIYQEILTSDYFCDLPTYSKEKFYYKLLVDLTQNCIEKQNDILHSAQFLTLPRKSQANLIRFVANEYLLKSSSSGIARKLIIESLTKNPLNFKTLILLVVFINPGFARRMVNFHRKDENSKIIPDLLITDK